MANRYIRGADATLGSAYNPAQANIQGQLPEIAELYDSLIAGLGEQQGAGLQTILDSAATRGVSRASLAGQVNATLGQEADVGIAGLGLAETEDVAAVKGNLLNLKTSRVKAATEYGRTLQDEAISKSDYKLRKKISMTEQKMEMKKLERDAEMRKRAYAAAQARSGGGGGGSDEPTNREGLMAINGMWSPGKDSYVNPNQWNKYRAAWIADGRSAGTFDSQFRHLVNPKHQEKGSKLKRYKGQWITG